MHMRYDVALEAGALTVLPLATAEGKDQACKVLLPVHDAFIFM